MRKLTTLFSSVEGRIGRGQFWLGGVIVVLVSLAIAIALMGLGLGISTTETGTVQVNGGEASTFERQSWSLAPWPALLLSILAAFPLVVIGVKRRRDRNGSGIDVVGFWAISLLLQLLTVVGLGGDFLQIVSVAMSIWGLCLLVLLGILRGTVGPNKYGPDPLGTSADTKHA